MQRQQFRATVAIFTCLLSALFVACQPTTQSAPLDPPQPHAITGKTVFLPLLAQQNSTLPEQVSAPSNTGYQQRFDGMPSQPQPWQPDAWDITVHSRDRETWAALEPMQAAHGADCGPPPASHTLTRYEDAVYLCHDHMMTAIKAEGYGVIYLTPNQMVDLSNGEATISWDMSTLRTSKRDWVDLWITPYDDNLQLPLENWLPDLQGEPRNAIHIRMDTTNDQTFFRGEVIRDFVTADVTTNNWTGYESVLTPDARRRDRFELRLSRTHITFGMPEYDLWWVDAPIADLGWGAGVVQFGHHSYNPAKDCSDCAANTWHWDNISIDPAVPFTIMRAAERAADAASGGAITLPAPAPADAHLRFAGVGKQLALSFDRGKTWQAAQRQAQPRDVEEHFSSFWTPIPAGTRQVLVRGEDWWGGAWTVRDVSVWSPKSNAPTAAVPPGGALPVGAIPSISGVLPGSILCSVGEQNNLRSIYRKLQADASRFIFWTG